MQTPQLSKIHTLTDIISAAVASLRETTTAVYKGAGIFEGDFSKLMFTENPANAFETSLLVNGVIKNGCKLTASNRIVIKNYAGFGVGVSYSISECAPFFYDCNVKELNLVETAQPAIWLPRPQNVELFNSNAESYGTEINLVLVFSDNADHEDWRVADQRSTGFVENQFNLYIERPQNLTLSKLISKLDNFEYQTGGGFTSQVLRTGNVKQTYVRRFGDAPGLIGLGFDADLSGLTVEIPLKILSTHCAIY